MTAQFTDAPPTILGGKPTITLPPLILHPFGQAAGPQKIAESSRASLIMQGLLPAGDSSEDDLRRTVLDGRYSEVRMLYYVGKDLRRWMDQCVDFAGRTGGTLPAGILPQSFAALLIEHTPENVAEKLRRWGVSDFRSIFTRGLGLNAMFTSLPLPEQLAEEFLRSYFQFADQLFAAYQSQTVFPALDPVQYEFQLFSSAEYARLLERAWE